MLSLPRFSRLHIKSIRSLPKIGMVIFLVFGVILTVSLALQPQIFNKRAAKSNLVDLKFVPDNLLMEAGRTYQIKAAIDPKGERVTAVKLHIKYDPGVISILETTNNGFLPVTLKIEDSRDGNLTLVYASTIDSDSSKPGIIAGIQIKALNPQHSLIELMSDSEVSVASREGNVLTDFPKISVEPVDDNLPGEPPKYPDNLLLEKAFFPSSSPFVRDFRESLEPKPQIKPGRIEPEISVAFIKQLGSDIFISPIVALNQVLEYKVGGVFGK